MRKSFILTALALCAILSSCMKSSKPDAMVGGSTIYYIALRYNMAAMDPAYIALRLNALLIESDNMAELNDFDGENREKLFGNATFVREGTKIRISFPEDYGAYMQNADDYFWHRGDIIVETNGSPLNTDGAVWTVQAATETGKEFSRMSNSEGAEYSKWDAYRITCNLDRWNITFSNFLSFYANYEHRGAKWSGTATLQPNDMTQMGYDGLMRQPRTLVECSSSGNEIGETAPIEYQVLEPLVYNPTCTFFLTYSGKEFASYPYLPQIAPDFYPAADATVVWSGSADNCNPSVTLYYNGMTR